MKNIISNDVSRCINRNCKIKNNCKRWLQNEIDKKIGGFGVVSIAEFKEENCEFYLEKK